MKDNMIGTVTFKKFTGEKLPNTFDYIKEYINTHKDTQIIIGTDSQNKNKNTVYSTVIVLYTPGHGGHCLFRRWKTPKERVRQVRLLREVEESINIANELVQAGCPRPEYIDLDINPNPKYKSNEVYQTARGWVESMGYEVRFKTLAPLVTTVADWLVKM
jgi:predicted RNase H-related nuclease YkuK (DUF458 family)